MFGVTNIKKQQPNVEHIFESCRRCLTVERNARVGFCIRRISVRCDDCENEYIDNYWEANAWSKGCKFLIFGAVDNFQVLFLLYCNLKLIIVLFYIRLYDIKIVKHF